MFTYSFIGARERTRAQEEASGAERDLSEFKARLNVARFRSSSLSSNVSDIELRSYVLRKFAKISLVYLDTEYRVLRF